MNWPNADRYYPIDLNRLPAGWVAASVGEVIFNIQPGFASGVHNQDGLGVPHLRPMNINREGCLDFSVVKYVPPDDPLRITRGDILFNNTNSPELVGKTTSIDRDGQWAFSNHMTRLRPPDGIVSKFVAHQLHFLWAAGYFRHRCTHHVNQASIASKTLAGTVPLAVPPTGEQHCIVAEIEKQLTRLDAAVAALRRIQANLKRYRAAVLKAACEGRLVPTEAELARRGGRDYEPADQLLARILKERRAAWEADQLAKMQAASKPPKDDKWKAKYQEPTTSDTSDLPELPEGWTWASIGQTFEVFVGATPSRVRPEYWGGNIPWVSSGEVAFRRIHTTREMITRLGFQHSSTELHPPGTVLLGMIGEGRTRGQVAILDIVACNNQNSAAIRVSRTGLPPEYIYRFLEGQYEKTRRIGSGNNQPALNKSRVQAMVFPLPPLAEQQRIVLEVERRLSVIDEFEATVDASLKRAERLRQAILKRAFEGKLVPQDPNDEPAIALLERIRAERTKAEQTRAPRGERSQRATSRGQRTKAEL